MAQSASRVVRPDVDQRMQASDGCRLPGSGSPSMQASSYNPKTLPKASCRRPGVWAQFASAFRIGAVAFGGGYAILPLMEAELVDRRGWLKSRDINEAYALGQSIPGVIAINTATLLGVRLDGRRGACLAAAGAALPAFLVILIIAAWLPAFQRLRPVQAVLLGIRPAVVAIIVRAAWRIGRQSLRGVAGWVVLVATLFLMTTGWVNPVVPIVIAAGGGGLLAWRAPRLAQRLLLAGESDRP